MNASPNPRKERSTFEIWKDTRFDQGERLVNFEKWVATQLAERLQWPSNSEKAKKQVLQCRALILQAVADMGKHGFLFRPKEIASMITAKLDEIGERQRRGEVRDLYAYLKITWSSYVTGQSDQLRQKAMNIGDHISQIAKASEALPLIVAKDQEESIREKKKRAARKLHKPCSNPADTTLPLFQSSS